MLCKLLLICTATIIDKFGELAFENAVQLCMYKGLEAVSPVCMVDYVHTCTEFKNANGAIDAEEQKRLTLRPGVRCM